MTYALSVILWMATAQTAGQPAAAPAAPSAAAPAAVVVQCPPSDAERALRAQLDEARGQRDEARGQLKAAHREVADAKGRLARLKEEASMPDHAVAALLVSDHPNLAPLKRLSWRTTLGAGQWRIRDVEVDVYVSPHVDETMTAVVLTLRNPREMPTWEPKEAFISAPAYSRNPPVPVAVRSSPERIRPGETARVALVFDRLDVNLKEPYSNLALFRDGKWEMEIGLQPSDFQVASTR